MTLARPGIYGARRLPSPAAEPWKTVLRIASVAALLLLAACKVELYSGLDEREANEMVAVLLNQGIAAERVAMQDGTLTVRVEEGRFADAVDLLKRHGYPRQQYASMSDVFAGDGLISSPVEEQARLIYALSQELSRTISEIDGVLSARVHVVLPENDALRSGTAPSSASVFIRHRAGMDLGTLMPQIKMLVANSIEGLVYDNVSVVLVPVKMQAAVAPDANALTSVAGIWVHESSAFWVGALIATTAAVIFGALGAGCWMLWRRRQTIVGQPAE
ncbi:MAG TPA: type III secretion inner membrane ring lipoprotein SctJ [Alphaproteobacteria bacterium]|nr:type III secretion inner membrane ring lipoprotein SctJ [Alphaproteobacteria bacterium]